MDMATTIGLAAAIGMCFWSLWLGTRGQLGIYWNAPSAILVFGGTVFVLLMTQAIDRYLNMWRVIKCGFFTKRRSVAETIEQIVRLGELARREGVLSLESTLGKIEDEFMANGIRLVIDGTTGSEIEQILNAELEAMDQRHNQGRSILDLTAKYAPAFGMIGTLIGLVAMLRNMDDPKAIGPGMATAILTTFYGAMIAYVLCLPLADKLNFRHEEEMLLRTVMLKGIMSLQAGDNPRITMAKLSVFLPVNRRRTFEGPGSQKRGEEETKKKDDRK